MTSSPTIIEKLRDRQCPGKDAHPSHHPCSGEDAKLSECYTPMMADLIHEAVREESLSFRAAKAMVAAQPVESEYAEAEEEMSNLPKPAGHRPKLGPEGLWCAMVTKSLPPGDPLCKHPKAKEALEKELSDLRSKGTWDEDDPREAAEVAKANPPGTLRESVSDPRDQHFEDVESQKFKARVVLAGHMIKTADGMWPVFQELGAVPSTMAACRLLLIAFCLVKDTLFLQSDCIRAYVQATMKGPATWIRIPKPWWPKHWAERFRDPVCRLRKALYGHPEAGNFWFDKLFEELTKLDFKLVEGWSSVFILHAGTEHTIAFVVYVDDLLMWGSRYLLEIIKRVRENIEMEEPADLQKYLGCVHHNLTEGDVRRDHHRDRVRHVEITSSLRWSNTSRRRARRCRRLRRPSPPGLSQMSLIA